MRHSFLAVGATRKLLIVQTLAGFSQWIDIFLIFSVPAFLWKSSPAEIALIASCFGLPSLFLGPLVGVFLDRTNPHKVAIAGALARTVMTAGIAFAPGFFIFAVLVALKGLANLCYWPATSILTNRIVDQPDRVNYFSSLSALDQLTKIATPLSAASLVLLLDSQLVFLLSAALTAICASLLAILPMQREMPITTSKRTFEGAAKELLSGLTSIRTLPQNLILSILLGVGMSLVLAVYDPHLAAFLNFANFSTRAFSLTLSATAVGAVTGALFVRFYLCKSEPGVLMRVGSACFTLAVCCAAIVANVKGDLLNIASLIAIWFLNGLGYEIFLIGSSVNMQNLCPPNLLGRINTSARSFQMAAVVIGPSIGAWVIGTYSRGAPFLLAAAASLLLLGVATKIRPATRP